MCTDFYNVFKYDRCKHLEICFCSMKLCNLAKITRKSCKPKVRAYKPTTNRSGKCIECTFKDVTNTPQTLTPESDTSTQHISATQPYEGKANKSKGRSGADTKAQHEVPEWYGKACILCGFPRPQGAHIVPVRTINNFGIRTLWYKLRTFWPLPTISEGDLETNGQEFTNILPMCPNAHCLWDCYDFALRPIEDQDPEKRHTCMYLQLLWLKPQGATAAADTLSDFRRVRAGPHPGIRHGDVYKITTADPATCPLPDFRLLEIQLGAHKIMAGIRAAAAAGDIFRGTPPDDDDLAIPSDRPLPTKWQVALDAAVEYGALDVVTAERWRTVLLWDMYKRYGQFSDKEPLLSS